MMYTWNKIQICHVKSSIEEEENFFTSKLVLNLSKKLEKCYIWNIPSYGSETLTFQKVYQKWNATFEA
jgi:hypothetical protein